MSAPAVLPWERQFITKEFADALADKQPHPYLRLHDPVQKALVDTASGPYLERMIHFWREISLAGMKISGRRMDECYALLFESAFDLAQAEPEWAAKTFAETDSSNYHFNSLKQLNHQLCRPLNHGSLVDAFRRCYAPLREEETRWQNPVYVAMIGDMWFWAAIACAAGIDENHPGWGFRCDLTAASSNGWVDGTRLHARLIREAPRLGTATPRDQLMAHPLVRLIKLKCPDNPIEQQLMVRFLNMRCIEAGFESEENVFADPLVLAQWVRDARRWAEQLAKSEPETYASLLLEAGREPVEACRQLFKQLLDGRVHSDSIDVAIALVNWAKRMRGFDVSWYRAQLWEFIVHVIDAALWLGWLFSREKVNPRSR